MKYLLFAPGYVLLAIAYYFPKEWGSGRNTSMTARQWKKRDFFAVWYTIGFYLLCGFFYIA